MSILAAAALAASLTAAPQNAPGASADQAVDWREAEAFALANHRQLTFPDRFVKAGEAYFSPDDQRIIFQAVERPTDGGDPDPFYAMFVADLVRDADGRIERLAKIRRVSPEGSANTCGWFHPTDANIIVFGTTIVPPTESSAPGYQRGSGRYKWMFPPQMRVVRADLRTADGTPGSLEVLAGDGTAYVAEGSIALDGRTMLYCSLATNQGDLVIKDLVTGAERVVVGAPGYDGGPFFSPDGRRICYRSDRFGNNLLQIFVADLKFDPSGRPIGISAEHQVTDNDDVNWAPFWHPSARHLVYASSAVSHRNYEVFIVDAYADDDVQPAVRRYGTAERRLTHAPGADVLPVFSSTGETMMWTSQRGDDASSQIWVADFVMNLDQPSSTTSGAYGRPSGGERPAGRDR